VSTTTGKDDAEQRVERVLEESLKRVESPRAAHAVVVRLERLSAGQTEAERGRSAAEQTNGTPGSTAATIERAAPAAAEPAPEQAVADVLEQVAAQSVAPTPAAEPVVEAAQAKLTPSQQVAPEAQRGRQLLKQALLRRMDPLNALDAEIYLAVNEAPHPAALDTIAWMIALGTTGGWIWQIAALVAYLLRVPRSWLAFKRLLPSVVIATWLVEYPIKAFFRRRRPFVRIVQALVIGKKPGSWSFPSGHTAASFASAWIMSSVWPRRAPIFFSVAGLVGFSRIYVGAHYPGDVASGAVLGMLLSESVRRVLKRVVG
jgi:membrane-associated phospholipid phosphatase